MNQKKQTILSDDIIFGLRATFVVSGPTMDIVPVFLSHFKINLSFIVGHRQIIYHTSSASYRAEGPYLGYEDKNARFLSCLEKNDSKSITWRGRVSLWSDWISKLLLQMISDFKWKYSTDPWSSLSVNVSSDFPQ